MTEIDRAILEYGKAPDRDELLNQLIPKLEAFLIPILCRTCWEQDDVSDVLQETFIKLVVSVDRLRYLDRPSYWIAKVAKNLARNANRRRSRRPRNFVPLDDVEDVFALGLAAQNPSVSPEVQDRLERLEAAIKLLNEKLQRLIRAKLTGKSNSEIAKMTGLTKHSVATLLSRAKKELKATLTSPRSNE